MTRVLRVLRVSALGLLPHATSGPVLSVPKLVSSLLRREWLLLFHRGCWGS
jgi:hypothetical protein